MTAPERATRQLVAAALCGDGVPASRAEELASRLVLLYLGASTSPADICTTINADIARISAGLAEPDLKVLQLRRLVKRLGRADAAGGGGDDAAVPQGALPAHNPGQQPYQRQVQSPPGQASPTPPSPQLPQPRLQMPLQEPGDVPPDVQLALAKYGLQEWGPALCRDLGVTRASELQFLQLRDLAMLMNNNGRPLTPVQRRKLQSLQQDEDFKTVG